MCGLTGSIVTFQTDPAILRKAIRSFLDSSVADNLLVIDNSPTKDLQKLVTESGAEYMFSGFNMGFGRAHNIALRRFLDQSEYHLVLNPDVSFDPSVLNHLLEFMECNRAVGLVMPKVVYPDGSMQYLCKKLPRPFDLFARRFLPAVLESHFRTRMHDFECRHLDLNNSLSIPYLSGCFMFLRMKAVHQIGLFDEKIFMYLEDTDLTRRLHEVFETVYYPYVAVVHEHGRGSYKDWRPLVHHIKATLYYFSKWGWFSDEDAKRINELVDRQTPGRFRKVEMPTSSSSFELTEAHQQSSSSLASANGTFM